MKETGRKNVKETERRVPDETFTHYRSEYNIQKLQNRSKHSAQYTKNRWIGNNKLAGARMCCIYENVKRSIAQEKN